MATPDLTELERLVRDAPTKARIGVRRALTELGQRGVTFAKGAMLSGQRLHVRSGRLRGSVGSALDTDGDRLVLRLRAGGGPRDVRYAGIQDHGGVIRPRRGKYLAIPVGPALTASGVARYASPRDVPGLFVWRSHSGRLMLGRRTGKKGRLTAYFLLVRSVRVPASRYLTDTMDMMRRAAPEVVLEAARAAVGES